jgi:prepilin-type processing-associated H-X9-DG protein
MAFMVMSNELGTAKILYCPSDSIRDTYSTNFSYAGLFNYTGTTLTALTANATRISYFINGDATEADPQNIMTGDCNIGNQTATASAAAASFRFGASATSEIAQGCTQGNLILAASFATTAGAWAWTLNDLHQKTGNIGMADGSCQSATVSGLHTYLQNSTNTINSCINFIN